MENKTSKAQLKAVSNWNAKNPLNVTYNQKKRAARSFVLIDLKGNTKGAKAKILVITRHFQLPVS